MNPNPENLRLPFTHLIRGLPGVFGIRHQEGPRFYVIAKEGDYQIRKYRPYLIARITVPGSFDIAAIEGFRKLSGYLSGNNWQHERIQIMAPVLQEATESDEGKAWSMSVILPARFNSENVPQPADINIRIIKIPSLVVAAYRFSGASLEMRFQEKTQELLKWLEGQKDYLPASSARFARYDMAKVLPFLRRNEVHITLGVSESKKKKM